MFADCPAGGCPVGPMSSWQRPATLFVSLRRVAEGTARPSATRPATNPADPLTEARSRAQPPAVGVSRVQRIDQCGMERGQPCREPALCERGGGQPGTRPPTARPPRARRGPRKGSRHPIVGDDVGGVRKYLGKALRRGASSPGTSTRPHRPAQGTCWSISPTAGPRPAHRRAGCRLGPVGSRSAGRRPSRGCLAPRGSPEPGWSTPLHWPACPRPTSTTYCDH